MGNTDTREGDPRSEAFGYTCYRCRKCCHHKGIQLNPYEIARLARNRGLTTSEFRSAYTKDGAGLHLAQTSSGACVFLGDDGCSVHPDRPLVCRLYPLGRVLNADGTERFVHVETHPESLGEFSHSGTIADFLSAQDVDAFMRAADDYYYWLCAASDHLDAANNGAAATASAVAGDSARDLLDMDDAVARYCRANGTEEPADLEARRKIHLTVLYQQLGQSNGESHEQA